MENPKFVLFKDQGSEYRFRLQAKNGETILASEGYTTKQNCQNVIASVKVHSPNDSNYQRLTATNGQYYFTLRANNNEIIGVSEMYTTTAGRDNGIEAVKRDAPDAPTEDRS